MKDLTLGILAHVDAGKTTLSEALLYKNHAIRTQGRVDHQDAFLDTSRLEKERGITIYSKGALFQIGDLRIQLLDTPGHADFSAEMERVLSVLDCAVLVISAADGVQSHTRTLWKLLEKYEVPVFLFINKTDRIGVDLPAVLNDIRGELDSACLPFYLPEKTAAGNHPSDRNSSVKRDLSPDMEEIAMTDEELLTSYLERGSLSDQEIRLAIRRRRLFPVCAGSALHLDGIDELIEILSRFAEAPDYPEEFGARIYKISRDERGNRLTHLKVTGGTLSVRQTVSGTDRNGEKWSEKIHSIRIYNGDSFTEVPSVEAGRVCTVTGLTRTSQGSVLGFEKSLPAPVLTPVLNYRLVPLGNADPASLYRKLAELEEEEPELNFVWKEARQEIQVQIMGEVQTEILTTVIKERLGVDVAFADGSIMYRETVASVTEGVGHYEPLRHYAEVHLLISPGERGSGYTVSSAVSSDELAVNWQRLITTHLQERVFTGVLTGSPLTDVHFTIAAGKASLKHTDGGDFRQATYRAVRQGLMHADNVLLEPCYRYVLELPSEYTGRAMTDLDAMFAVDTSIEQNGDQTILRGEAPVATMRNYHTAVNAYSRGSGRLTLTVSGYRPCHNTEEVLAESSYDPDADTDNPSWSVFCTHGSGIYIPWYEVPDFMHLPPVLKPAGREEEPEAETAAPSARTDSSDSLWISPEEVEAIMKKTFYANSSPEKRRPSFKKNRSRRQASAAEDSQYLINRTPALDKYLLIDGYNVIFAWEELSGLARINIDAARESLQDILCNYRSMTDAEIILVFDAYKVRNHAVEISDYGNIHVVFTKTAQTADAYIEKFTHDNRSRYDITVVTSDGLEQIIIRGQGARLISSHEFENLVREVNEEIRSILTENRRSIPVNKIDLSALKNADSGRSGKNETSNPKQETEGSHSYHDNSAATEKGPDNS